MEPKAKLLALCALLIPLALAVPLRDYNDYNYYDDSNDAIDDASSGAAVEWQTTQCARHHCQEDNSLVRFDKGKTYFYALQTDTQIQAGPEWDQPQLVQLQAQVMVSAHSNCEMSLQLTRVQLKGLSPHVQDEYARALQSQPLHFAYNDGIVTDVCPHQSSSSSSSSNTWSSSESAWIVNVQKSIVSALQMSARSLQSDSVVVETDIVGQCETLYRPQRQRFATNIITKSKQLNKCAKRQSAQMGLFPRSYGNSVFQNVPLMNASYSCQQTIDKDLIVGATCRETQQLRGTHVTIDSLLNLRFEKQQNGLEVRRNQRVMKRGRLLMTNHQQQKQQSGGGGETEMADLLRQMCQQLSSERKSETLNTFPQLVQQLSRSQQAIAERVWRSVARGELCSQHNNQLKDLVLDASAQSGSEAGLSILMEALEQKQISEERSAFLFSLLAFSSEPSDKAVKKAVDAMTSRDLNKHVILGMSGLLHNARLFHQNDKKEVESQCRHALQQLEKRAQQEKQQEKLIGLIKAMENIGLDLSPSARQLLVEMATNQRQSSQSVRVAAVKALASSRADSQQRNQLMEVFAREEEENEIRIEAYKAVVMSGADRQQLDRIKQVVQSTRNTHVQQYVRAHQHNLRESSDPHKKDVLRHDAPRLEKPKPQWFGISNNFESSFMLDALSLGVAFEADVIHSSSSGGESEREKEIPRAITLNFSIPAFGKELQLLEVNVRQKGFSRVISDQMKRVHKQSNNKGDNKGEGWFSKRLIAEAMELFATAQQWSNQVGGEDLELEVHVKVDGKTVLSQSLREIRQNANALIAQWKREIQSDHVSVDRALAFQPVNTRVTIATQNGFPITVRVNATLFASLSARVKSDSSSKGYDAEVAPAFGLQFDSGVDFALNKEQKSVEMVARVTTEPTWKSSLEIKDKRIANLKIFAEKQKQNLLKVEKHFYRRNAQNQRQEIQPSAQTGGQWCSQQTKKPIGLELCAKVSDNVYEVSLEKSDSRLKSFDFAIESPPKGAREMQSWRLAFNTPNSDVNREMSAELLLTHPSANSGRGELKLSLRSPWARYSALAQMRNEEKEQSVKVELEGEGHKKVSIDAGVEMQTRGQKREYRPRLRIQYGDNQEVVEMAGSVSLSKGRKNQLQINLEGNQKQFLKGSFVREGERKSNDLRVATDLTINIPGVELRVHATGDKGVKQMASEVLVEYKIRDGRKESFKFSSKVQNLTQTQMTKVSAFAEMQSSQFPSRANFHIAYNLMRKPEEHVENEVTIAWKEDFKEKVHVLQVSRRTQQSDKAFKVENTLDLEITPLRVNYELRANADVQQDMYQVELVGKDRTGRKENDVKGTLEYKHVSRSPLHLTMEAVLRTSGRELKYEDSLREVSQGEYKGDTSVQWAQGKKAVLEYNYKQKPGFHHEIDMQVQMPGHQAIKHSSLLRMSRDECEVKAKVHAFGKQVLDSHALLNAKRDSRLALALNSDFEAKVHVNPHSVPALASWQVTRGPFTHMSNVELVPHNSLSFKSDTKNNDRNVFAIESHVSRVEPSRIIVTSQPMDGRLDFGVDSEQQLAANLEINSNSDDWKHASEFAHKPSQRVILVKSKTELKGKPIYSLDSQWSRAHNKPSFVRFDARDIKISADADLLGARKKSLNWELNVEKRVNHKTDFAVDSQRVNLDSITKRANGARLASIEMDLQKRTGISTLKSRFGDDYRLDVEAKHRRLSSDDLISPYVSVSGQNSAVEHNSRITFDRNNLIASSKTSHRNNGGQNVLAVNAQLARALNAESSFNVDTPSVRSVLKTTPSQSVDFEWNSPRVNHVTRAQWKPNEYGLDSKTQFKASRAVLNLSGKHLLRQSFIQTQNALFDARADFERGENDNKKVKVEFKANSQYAPQYQHVTLVEHVPQQQLYTWQSSTNRAQDSQGNVFQTKGEYAHAWTTPSKAEFKYGDEQEARVTLEPNQRKASLEWKSRDSQHKSDLEFSQNALTIKSRADAITSGRDNTHKIDAFLSLDPEQKSHFSLVSPKYSSQIELEPKKRLNLQFTASPIEHQTEIQVQTGKQWQIKSQTKRNAENVFDLNSSLNFPQKSAKIGWNSRDFQHNSELNENEFNSKSVYKKRLIHDLRARVLNNELNNESEKHLELETPLFHTKSVLTRDSASLDFKSRLHNYQRHLLASVQCKDGFHSELAWDVDQDANQRIVIDARTRRSSYSQNQQINELSASYAGNELKFTSEMTRGQLVNGPHTWSAQYTPAHNAQRDAIGVEVKHEIRDNNQMQCNFVYREAQTQKFSAKLNAKIAQNDNNEQEVTLALVTIAPSNPDLEIDVTFNERHSSLRRRNAQIFAELKALKTSLGKQYLVQSTFSENSAGKIVGEVVVETPGSGQRKMNFELDVNARANQLTLSATNQNAKQFEMSASAHNRALEFELKSNVKEMPSVKAHAQYVQNQGVSATLDVDSERKIDFSVEKSGQSVEEGVELRARLYTSYLPKMEAKSAWKLNSRELLLETSAKYDLIDLFSAQISAERSARLWSGTAHVAVKGAELGRASLRADSTQNSLQYIFDANAKQLSRIHVTFASETMGSLERKVSLKVCSEDEKCVDLKTDVRFQRLANGFRAPEKVWLSLTKMGTNLELKASLLEKMKTTPSDSSAQSLLGLTQNKAIHERLRNQLLVSINAHSIGFEHVMTSRDYNSDAIDSLVNVYLPTNQRVEVKSDFARNQNSITMKNEFRSDARESQPLFDSKVTIEKKSGEYSARLEVNSAKFKRNPKSIEIECKSGNRKFFNRILIDLAQDQNRAITITTQGEQKPIEGSQAWMGASTQYNRTLDFSLSTRDKRTIDLHVKSHVSPKTIGLVFKNANRNGVKREGFYFLQRLPNNRFEGIARDDWNAFRVWGSFAKSARELSSDLELLNEKSGEKREMRVAFDKQCLKWETKKDMLLVKKKQICLNLDNDRSPHLSFTDDNQIELSLQADATRDRQVKLRVQWSPAMVSTWLKRRSQERVSDEGMDDMFARVVERIADALDDSEMIHELRDKYAKITRQLNDDFLFPILNTLSDNFGDIFQELLKNFAPLESALNALQQLWDTLVDKWVRVREWAPDSWEDAMDAIGLGHVYKAWMRYARKQCKRSEMCYKLIYALENYGFESLLDLFYSNVFAFAKQTHKLVLNTQGQLNSLMPQLMPYWAQDLYAEYRQSIVETIQSIIESNAELNAVWTHAQTIADELANESEREIEWVRVKGALRQMGEALLRKRYSWRVVQWEPRRGLLEVELYAGDVTSRSIRSLFEKSSQQMKKSMFS